MKLHLGCGLRKIHGFVNIDALESVKPDVVENVFTLPTFKSGTIEMIYACHVLEHSSRATYMAILERWFDLLEPGGTLRVAVPDLRAAMSWYLNHGNLDHVMGFLYGGQVDRYDHHGMGWDEVTLRRDLYMAGFDKVEKYDWRITSHFYVDDYSQSYLPKIGYFTRRSDDSIDGSLMSLNVEAKKA